MTCINISAYHGWQVHIREGLHNYGFLTPFFWPGNVMGGRCVMNNILGENRVGHCGRLVVWHSQISDVVFYFAIRYLFGFSKNVKPGLYRLVKAGKLVE